MRYKSDPRNVKEALLLAIGIEQHNRICYRNMSWRFSDYNESISILMNELAKEEYVHETILRANYLAIFHKKAPYDTAIPSQLSVFMDKVEKLNSKFLISTSPSAELFLKIAIEIERCTQQYYYELKKHTNNAKLSEIYKEFADAENEHEILLLEHLEQVSFRIASEPDYFIAGHAQSV